MHNIWKTVVAVVAVSSLGLTTQAWSQDKSPAVMPVELYSCTFNEGKGMDDLNKVTEKFRKWSKKNQSGYSAWTITPNFRAADGEFDVGWIGSSQTSDAFGKGMDNWVNDNDGLAAAFNDVISCSHSLVSSVAINAPDGPADNGVVMFSSCTRAEGKNDRDAYEAHKGFSDAMRAMGGKGQSWIMYPALGFGKMEFDYYVVTGFQNYAELGEGWNLYTNGKGYEKAAAMMGGVTSCDSPRVYDARLVVGNKK